MGRTINVTRVNRSSANIIVSKTTWYILFRAQKTKLPSQIEFPTVNLVTKCFESTLSEHTKI